MLIVFSSDNMLVRISAREQSLQKVQLNQGKRKSGIWHKCGKCGQAFTGKFQVFLRRGQLFLVLECCL